MNSPETQELCRIASETSERTASALFDLMKVIIANPDSDPNAIISIFYIHLVPEKVPDRIVTDIHLESSDVQLNVNCALHVIKYIPGFAMLSRNPQTMEGLRMQWPHIWKWLQFFYTSWIQNPLSGNRGFAYSAVTSMIALFTTQDDLVSTIRPTLDCLEMTVNLWRLNVLAPFRTEKTAFPPATVLWERLCSDETRQELDHTITFLGASPDAVVHTLLQHFDAACDHAREDPAFLRFVDSDMDFMCEFRHSDSLRNSLVSHHSVRSITKQLASSQSLDGADPGSVADCIIKCCHYLRYALDWGDGISCVIESLEAQLLPALIGANAFIPYMHANLVCHVLVPLTEILPKYLVYRSVCRAVARSFRNIDKERLEEGMTRVGTFWEAWTTFRSLVEERLAFHALDEGRSTHYVCGNKQCSKVDLKDSFNRCGGCSRSYYCSRTCQTIAWSRGHKRECKEIQRCRQGGKLAPIDEEDLDFAVHVAKWEIFMRDRRLTEAWLHNAFDVPVIDADLNCYPYNKMRFGSSITLRPDDPDLNAQEPEQDWDEVVETARQQRSGILRFQFPAGEYSKIGLTTVPKP